MEKSSFFNSVSGDRVYRAEEWAEYFASFIGNGVFPVPSTSLQVVAGPGMAAPITAPEPASSGLTAPAAAAPETPAPPVLIAAFVAISAAVVAAGAPVLNPPEAMELTILGAEPTT